MKIVKKFMFSAAHYLPDYVGKCKQLHGHTYFLDVLVEGEINPDTGMVIDFYDLKHIVESKVISKLDHKLLNDIVENPTAENIIMWVKNELGMSFKEKVVLKLWESPESYVEL